MKPMKILLPVHVFFPQHFYGTETYTLELAKQFMAKGHIPIVLTATPSGEKGSGELYSKYEYDHVTVYCVDLNLKPHNRFKQTYYRKDLYSLQKEIIKKIGPDIAHVTHLINHSSVLLEVLRDLRIPAVATLTDFFGICLNNKLERYDGRLCNGPNRNSTNCLACYFRAEAVRKSEKLIAALAGTNNIILRLAVSALFHLTRVPRFGKNSLAGHILDVTGRTDLLRDLYGTYEAMIAPTVFLRDAYAANRFYPDRLKKINFGINLDLVSEFSKPKVRRGSQVRFGYIGQIAHHKGVDLLIKAYAGIKNQNKSLVIYGPYDQEPAYMEELKRLASNLNKVEFRGTFPQQELGQRLYEMDFLVIPSRWYENSPLVLLFALAAKTPVIVTDVQGLSEFVDNGVNGYTFKKDRIDHLRKIMQDIVDHPSRNARLSENATYTRDVADYAGEVLDLYESVLSRNRVS
jgi:glycosyltransferase involved in cell wall biosynthesis